jgi:hypothetical protein
LQCDVVATGEEIAAIGNGISTVDALELMKAAYPKERIGKLTAQAAARKAKIQTSDLLDELRKALEKATY